MAPAVAVVIVTVMGEELGNAPPFGLNTGLATCWIGVGVGLESVLIE